MVCLKTRPMKIVQTLINIGTPTIDVSSPASTTIQAYICDKDGYNVDVENDPQRQSWGIYEAEARKHAYGL